MKVSPPAFAKLLQKQGLGLSILGLIFMGKNKARNTTNQTTRISYEDRPHSATADEATARQTIANVDSTAPIHGAFNRAEGAIRNQYYEEDLPEGVEDEIRTGKLFDLNMQKGAALSNAVSGDQQTKAGNQLALAGMTQNKTLQTGGTMSGTNYGEQWGSGLYSPLGQLGLGAVSQGLSF